MLGWGRGGQGGCERRIEVFGKIYKKKFRGGVGVGGVGSGGQVGGSCLGVRVDVNEGGGGSGGVGRVGRGVRCGGQVCWGGVGLVVGGGSGWM